MLKTEKNCCDIHFFSGKRLMNQILCVLFHYSLLNCLRAFNKIATSFPQKLLSFYCKNEKTIITNISKTTINRFIATTKKNKS